VPYIVGKNVTTRIGGAVVCQMGGSINDSVNLIERTNSCGNGYQEMEAGIRRASGNVRLTTKVGSIPDIAPGETFTLVVTNSANARGFNIPCIVESTGDDWVVNGEYNIVVNWQSSGSYTVSNE
jgi:hypothetical protein